MRIVWRPVRDFFFDFDWRAPPFYKLCRIEDKPIIASAPIHRRCPVCHSSDAARGFEKTGMKIVRCRRCAMQYMNPVPSEYATGRYYDQEAASYYLSAAKLESDYSPVRFERELRLFRKYCQAGEVLDVGCGSGAFLYQLSRCFPDVYRVLGTDVSGPPLDYAESRGVPVLRGEFLHQALGDRKFDAVTLWAVAEHLLEPALFLEKIGTILRPGGHCFVLVPNMKSLAVRILGPRYRYIYAQHLNYFTARTLRELAQRWFIPVETRYTHFNPIVIWRDWRSGGAEVSNAQRGQLLKQTTAYKQRAGQGLTKALYQMTESALRILRMTDNVALVMRKS
jgi:2-polyprenyl-3-methyl-5-hydroxy-6-metoxy-1,4-benzoquinol methylase